MSSHQFEAWCSQHNCHPANCFYAHNPNASKGGALSEEEQAEAVRQRHEERRANPEGETQHRGSTSSKPDAG